MTTTTPAEPDTRPAPFLRPFPLVNDWRRGCWVARPTGKPDTAYVYAREFVTGAPHKATGMVRYSLEDLGGPGWVVACDAYRVRSLIRVTEIGWEVIGELAARHILDVVQAGEWNGDRCLACGIAPIWDDHATCAECEREQERTTKAAAHLDTIAPEEVPF